MTTSANSRFWAGASAGILVGTVAVCAAAGYFVLSGIPRPFAAMAFALSGAAVFFALVTVARWLARLGRDVPARVVHYAAAALATLYLLQANRFRFRWTPALFYPAAIVFLAAVAILVGAFWARGSGRRLFRVLAVGAALTLASGLAWILYPGRDPYPRPIVPSSPVASVGARDPAAAGAFEVETLTYGSGTDRRRREFAEAVDVRSPTVDASKILPEWKGFRARAREWYWGFSIDEAPLNARVWMPVGDGPFPLVLVVHGNHGMEDDSDPGYAYLGELLASRGFITASVDENFINGTWSGDFRGKEMPMRAWLLLEHLRVWHEWNETEGHRFHGKVDTERIALIGHSRGGEAVSVAYAFNELERFPDDATVRFDYRFSIRALVAIAQTDRHYPRRVELENVNFLTLQGSYDSDEASSFGMRQFRRIRLDETPYRFKAGVYIHGANHGQFNTTWGMDSGAPSAWLLNRTPLISGDDQREIAKVYISAFVEATLHDDHSYLPLFRDPRAEVKWLPKDVVCLAQFEDSTFRAVADFEEDMDVTTATLAGAVIETEGLTVWREEALRFRDDLTQSTHGLVIGMDGSEEGSYAIRFKVLPPPVDPSWALTFFLSSTPETAGAGDASVPALSVELVDSRGGRRSVSLEDIAPVTPPLKIQFLKAEWLNRKRFPREWEATFQSYALPLALFDGVDVETLAAARLLVRGAGVVILDDVGFRRVSGTSAK